MYIKSKDWKSYISKLSALNKKAADAMMKFVQVNGFSDTEALINYAYLLATKYGEASAALSAQMYDALAELKGAFYEPALMAETASYGEVAKTIIGITEKSVSEGMISGAVGRLVKQAGADTTLQNALRDGAQFAWIPSGDTCAFCIALASEGWQYASKDSIKYGHAEHIHANCDCTYAVRFSEDDGVRGYDPGEYRAMYYAGADVPFENEDDSHPESKSIVNRRINGMRRAIYAQNKDAINAQKREAYALRKAAIESGELKG